MSEVDSLFEIKPVTHAYREHVKNMLLEEWGSVRVVSRGRLYEADKLSGFLAMIEAEPVGLITYNIEVGSCEIVTLNSLREKMGIGSALIDGVQQEAIEAGCCRLWLITTNDNTHALRFYQKRGFTIKAVYPNAIAESRKIKPEIPILGNDDIAIRDEIELQIIL